MKTTAIVLAGLLVLARYGCSSEDAKETAEKSKEAASATQEAALDLKGRAEALTKF